LDLIAGERGFWQDLIQFKKLTPQYQTVPPRAEAFAGKPPVPVIRSAICSHALEMLRLDPSGSINCSSSQPKS
jgi:hypothetical protein